jgi:hypothetical protein
MPGRSDIVLAGYNGFGVDGHLVLFSAIEVLPFPDQVEPCSVATPRDFALRTSAHHKDDTDLTRLECLLLKTLVLINCTL